MFRKLQYFFKDKDNRKRLSAIFESAALWSLKITVFIFPIFILPFQTLPLESMKAHLLLIGAISALALSALSAIFSSNVTLRIHGILYGLFASVVLAAASAVLGRGFGTSFLGLGGREMWSVVTYLSLFILTLLIAANSRKKENILSFVFAFGMGIALAGVFEILQLVGRFPFPFPFTRQRIWTSLGPPKLFAFFSSIGVLASAAYLRHTPKGGAGFGRLFAILAILADIWVLLKIDFYGAWLFLALGALLFYFSCFWAERRNLVWDKYFPLGAFIFALIFTMTGSPLRQNLIPEFNLDASTSRSIAGKSLKGNLFLGTGPGTFQFSYSLFRPASFNSGEYWNARFDRPENHFLTVLSTTGVLGLLAFISPFVFLGLELWKRIKRKTLRDPLPFLLSALAALSLPVSYFYASNIAFSWYAAVLLGLCAGIFGDDIKIYAEDKRGLELAERKYKFIGFGAMAAVLVVVLRLAVLEVSGLSGEFFLWKSGDIASSPSARYENAERALRYAKDEPRVLRAISKAALQYANELGRIKDIDGEKIQKLLERSTSSVKQATSVEPRDVENWLALGAVYQNLLPFVEGSGEWVVKAYTEALSREPSNPLPLVEMGKSYLTLGDRMSSSGVSKDLVQKIYQLAEEELIAALNLKADYAPIHFYLGLVYERQGRENDAVLKLEAVERFNPSDVGVAYELGLLYLKRGNLPKAESEFRRATELLPSYSDAHWQLANTLLRQGKPSEAIEELKKILQYNPQNQAVIKAIEEIKLGRTRL